MARYDEDIYDNPFFIALEKEHQQLFEKATANRWVICVPKFSVVKSEKLTKQDFEDHILTPDVEVDGAFVTVSKQKVEIHNGQINLGSGLKASKVDILFEETFYNVRDESYRIVCVSAFFNREISAESSDNSGDCDLSRPPANYDDCIKLLWRHQGSNKTRDSLDKALKIFCGEYQRYDCTGDNITDLADLVSSHVTKAMQIVLKDKHLKKQVGENDLYMASLRIAVETYMMNAVHKHLFSTITASVKSADALVNKMTRNLGEIRLHHLEVRREFQENLPMAKKELARLNEYSTPLGRTFCLKRVVTALTKPLFKSRENEDLVMTSDDLLPLLIYLIIKSQIPNWMANLTYMKYFQMVKVSETEEFSFYLATTEAALDYIRSGNVKEVKPTGHSKDAAYNRQISGSSTSSKEKFFQYVQFGDEAAVRLMLKKRSPTTDDVSSKLCHPLCTCEKCSEITVRSSQNSGAISPIARDDNFGRTALHIAAFHGQASLIDVLAKHGCLVDATDFLGCTPLHLACQKGYQNIILLLVHFGADIGTVENEGNTPLHLCAKNGHEDCVKAILFLDILKNKLNVNAKNDMGDTPLHLAAKWGYDGIVSFLLESEADPRIRNRKRQTAFNVAQNADIKKELIRVMKDPPPMIVNHPGIPSSLPVTHNTQHHPNSPSPSQPTSDTSTNTRHDKSPHGFKIVDVISVKPSIQMLDNSSSQMMSPTIPAVASLDNGNAKQIGRLYKAIANKDLPLVKYYFGWVDTPADDNTSPTSSMPSADTASSLCHPLCQCHKCQHIQKHSCLNTIDINCRNQQGWCPLHKAVTENNIDVLDLLLKKGAFVNVLTRKRVSPLHLACYHNNLEMVEKLVLCGANVNLQDQHGEIPLHLASAKASPNIVSFLLQHSSTVNLCNIEGYTPLHHAVCIGSVEVVKLLLEHGAIPDIITKQQSSPITMARNPVIVNMLKKKLKENPAVLPSKGQGNTPDIVDEQHNISSHPDTPSTTSTVDTIADNSHTSVVPPTDSHTTDTTAESPQASNESGVLQKTNAGLDTENMDRLKQIGYDIQSFDKQKSLKRSQTFDHSYTALNSASLKLSLSIQHFDKQKSLKRTPTFDKSHSLLRSLEHSSSIQHFDASSLKHVDPVDKSSPMHIYSLVRSYSAYIDHSDLPDEHVESAQEIQTDENTVENPAEAEEDIDSANETKLDKNALENPIETEDIDHVKEIQTDINTAETSAETAVDIDKTQEIQTDLNAVDKPIDSEVDNDGVTDTRTVEIPLEEAEDIDVTEEIQTDLNAIENPTDSGVNSDSAKAIQNDINSVDMPAETEGNLSDKLESENGAEETQKMTKDLEQEKDNISQKVLDVDPDTGKSDVTSNAGKSHDSCESDVVICNDTGKSDVSICNDAGISKVTIINDKSDVTVDNDSSKSDVTDAGKSDVNTENDSDLSDVAF